MSDIINIEDFQKIKMQVGKVISAEKVEGSNKLLKLRVSFGEFDRTIFSGIAKFYEPQNLVEKKFVFVTNLEPRKIKEEFSEGMILATEDSLGLVSLLVPDQDILEGSLVG